MEERLAQLKMQMGKERERRDAARQESVGSIWGSARTDASTTDLCREGPREGRKATPPVGGALAAARETRPLAERPLLAAPEPPPTTKPSNLAALLAGHQPPPQAPASFAQANQQQHAGAAGGRRAQRAASAVVTALTARLPRRPPLSGTQERRSLAFLAVVTVTMRTSSDRKSRSRRLLRSRHGRSGLASAA